MPGFQNYSPSRAVNGGGTSNMVYPNLGSVTASSPGMGGQRYGESPTISPRGVNAGTGIGSSGIGGSIGSGIGNSGLGYGIGGGIGQSLGSGVSPSLNSRLGNNNLGNNSLSPHGGAMLIRDGSVNRIGDAPVVAPVP
eukprot:CAMPEP_0170484476 /NCGR_PEP_ID=MMETSP0208-20121228/3942_1 /TAXON_ID=197538 /ORGANISM="Strombidium inclinatum, Strain S3" /LENGTH=137 /DNA_ID=CAMNT_0010757817 /DNA_START=836 /DNA_END=1249 /DNA_ORIENTATION=-